MKEEEVVVLDYGVDFTFCTSFSLTHYSFERNNPYNNKDPSGHCLEDGCVGEFILAGGFIGAGVQTGSYILSSYSLGNSITWKGIGANLAGGFAEGTIGATGAVFSVASAGASIPISGALGATASQIGSNIGDGDSWTKGLVQAAGLGALSSGLVNAFISPSLPVARTWLLKNTESMITTTTGRTALSNVFTEETSSSGSSSILQYSLAHSTNQGSSS